MEEIKETMEKMWFPLVYCGINWNEGAVIYKSEETISLKSNRRTVT